MREEDRSYFLGCSGYFYWHWKGKFYPPGLEPKYWLGFYSRSFNTVEINSTFYRLPRKGSLKRSFRETPDGFVFAVKMNRLVTHQKKLRDCRELIGDFMGVVSEALGEKLGPVLYQLPPSFKLSDENLQRVIREVPGGTMSVVEFRHKSWWNPDVYDALRERDITFCSVSMKGLPDDVVITSGVLYLRFHGLEGKYRYRYSERELEEWGERIKEAPAKPVFVYFNNDYNANSVENCLTLMEILGLR